MSEPLMMDRITANLTRLRLGHNRDELNDRVKTAQEAGQSYLGFLDELLQEEVEHKEQRRIETALKTSGLPFVKTIDEFDFAFQPGLDRRQVMGLFELSFVNQGGNVIILGPHIPAPDRRHNG